MGGMNLNKQTTGYGPRDAKLVILLDYPTRWELNSGIPLSGNHGAKVSSFLLAVGLSLSEIRVEYVVEREASDWKHFYEGLENKYQPVSPTSELLAWWTDLDIRLSSLPKKQVILAMGELASRAVTNESGIESCHSYVIQTKHGTVIPTYEPNHFNAHMFPHEDHWLRLAIHKAKEVLNGKTDVVHQLTIRPTFSEVCDYIQNCSTRQYLCVDIETDQTTYSITTIGLAISETEAISIPLKVGNDSYFKPEEEAQILHLLAELFANERIEKIFQNFIFDVMYLTRDGLQFRGAIHDTMYLAHVLNPELPKSLKDLARIYCYCSPWKDNTDWRGSESLWRYNARDCARTFQIFMGQNTEINERNLRTFTDNHITPLLTCIQDACVRGLRVDSAKLASVSELLASERKIVVSALEEAASTVIQNPPIRRTDLDRELSEQEIEEQRALGLISKSGAVKKNEKFHRTKGVYKTKEFASEPFNPSSPKQVVAFLRGLGYQVPTKDGSPCTDRKHLMKMKVKYGDPLFDKLIQNGNLKTLYGNYSAENLKLDPDGRLRWTYGIAETGRLRSYETPWDTGRNVQNFPREKKYNFKSIIIPDEGMLMGQLDLSQAEARVTAHVAGDLGMQRAIYEPATPGGKPDFHQYVADYMTDIMGKRIDRQFAKLINHAANYGMGAYTFLENCIANGVSISYQEAEEIIKLREDTFPDVKMWRLDLQDQIIKTRTLTNPFGRQRLFYGRIERDEEGKNWTPSTMGIFREGYAYVPQSTVADVINVIWAKLLMHKDKIQILQQCHDSLLFQCKPEDKGYVSELIETSSQVLIPIPNDPIIIPVDLKFGDNWGSV